jgi:hypothetical protein
MSVTDICPTCKNYWNKCSCTKLSSLDYNCTECGQNKIGWAYGSTGINGTFCSNYCLERYKNKTIETAILDTSVLIDYVIVDGDDTQSLSEKVNQYLKQGWKLQGGVSVIEVTAPIGRTYHLYSQAMVKYG